MTSPVLVIGAGPAGLATAACLKGEGLTPHLIDRSGLVGGAYRRLYPHIGLASPSRWISLPGCKLHTESEYVTVAQYSEYLQEYAAHFELVAEPKEVNSVAPCPHGFVVSFADGGQEEYAAVVAATGMDGLVWPEYVPNEVVASKSASDERPAREQGLPVNAPDWYHSSQWQGPAPFADRRLLVVGRGVSAVEIAEESARAGVSVAVSCRGKVKFGPKYVLGRDVHDLAYLFTWWPRALTLGYCDRSPTFTGYDNDFNRFVREGQLRVLPPVHHLEQKAALFEDGHREEFDAIVCATGYGFALPYLPADLARSPADGHPLANRGESVSHPGLFFVGGHCTRGVASQFLRGMALDAPAIARSISRFIGRATAKKPKRVPTHFLYQENDAVTQ